MYIDIHRYVRIYMYAYLSISQCLPTYCLALSIYVPTCFFLSVRQRRCSASTRLVFFVSSVPIVSVFPSSSSRLFSCCGVGGISLAPGEEAGKFFCLGSQPLLRIASRRTLGRLAGPSLYLRTPHSSLQTSVTSSRLFIYLSICVYLSVDAYVHTHVSFLKGFFHMADSLCGLPSVRLHLLRMHVYTRRPPPRDPPGSDLTVW